MERHIPQDKSEWQYFSFTTTWRFYLLIFQMYFTFFFVPLSKFVMLIADLMIEDAMTKIGSPDRRNLGKNNVYILNFGAGTNRESMSPKFSAWHLMMMRARCVGYKPLDDTFQIENTCHLWVPF